ncbi:MAG: riboflavin synthase [Helicobacteraceae bacterium]|jgi:riboflavin synthase|nr:riboflavin synthase [Helicobacteraceae bacterium]
MFTGLIKEIASATLRGDRLQVKASYRPKAGDSVAVNGACLTVAALDYGGFRADLSYETQRSIAVENLNGKAHIEPAMIMGDRFEGHIAQGHIDFIGSVAAIEKEGDSWNFFIDAPKEAMRLIAPKGSIGIDGVSLTINEVFDSAFRLTLVPHSLANTLFESYKVNRRVNIETDLFARYAARILDCSSAERGENVLQRRRREIDRMSAIF